MRRERLSWWLLLAIVFLCVAGLACAGSAAAGATAAAMERVSVTSLGGQGTHGGFGSAISGDGRFVAFASRSDLDLVNPDTNDVWDVYRHDRLSGETIRVSVPTGGGEAHSPGSTYGSLSPAISRSGRFVAFMSNCGDLVSPPPACYQFQVYVHDCDTGTTELVSRSFAELPASAGMPANDTSEVPDISASDDPGLDGRYVVFVSYAWGLVPGDTGPVDRGWQIYRYDRQTGTTIRVSVADGRPDVKGNGTSRNPAVSGDGRLVIFESDATNLVANDNNGKRDVFVHDCVSGRTIRVSEGAGGGDSNGNGSGAGRLSQNGLFATFTSDATNLVADQTATDQFYDVFRRDLRNSTTTQVSVSSNGTSGNGHCGSSDISDDGSVVAFMSNAFNFAPVDYWMPDVFVRNYVGPTTTLISMTPSGTAANGSSECAVTISGDGASVAFASDASNLLSSPDTNGQKDVFVYGPPPADTVAPVITISAPSTVMLGQAAYATVAVSDVGSGVAWQSVPSGSQPLDTSSVGTKVFAVEARDNGNNRATAIWPYRVIYDFMSAGGFQGPVRNPPGVNTVTAGSTVLLKWKVPDGQGGFISDTGTVTSLQYRPTTPPDAPWAPCRPARGAGLRNSGSPDYYFQFDWQTDRSMAGQTYQLALTLDDGGIYYAIFSFR